MKFSTNRSAFAGKWVLIVLLATAAFAGGYVARFLSEPSSGVTEHDHSSGADTAQKWYCSMDPQIIRDGPGKCPICGMALIPMPAGAASSTGARELVVSEEAARLMEVETSVVERKVVTAEVRMVGKIDYDETRLKYITAWVPGRIDRLYVDFTGISVKKGDHMVYLYSPDLISAQAELLQAAKAVASARDESSEFVKRSSRATLDASREKLRLLGLGAEQITEIESSGKALTHVTIYSPIGGVVIRKNATEGMYVETGTPIYTVADFSQVWVKLDAYESDLPWIRYGQEVEFRTEAVPGGGIQGPDKFCRPDPESEDEDGEAAGER